MKARNIDKRWGSEQDAADAVIAAIERRLARRHMADYSRWTIGVTASPTRRENELHFPGFWRVWKLSDDVVAQQVVAHFVNSGMQRGLPAESHGRYVYLF